MLRTAVALVGVLVLAGCSASQPATPAPVAAATPAPVAPASSAPDPYAVYLSKAPNGEPTLSREDASTRALLGCGRTWPPGTVDAVLAEAYAAYCR